MKILRPDLAEHSHSHSHSLLRLFAKCDNRDHTVHTAGSFFPFVLLNTMLEPLSFVCLMCACLLLSSCFSSIYSGNTVRHFRKYTSDSD